MNIDTIVVSAKKENFEDIFIGQNCWYSVIISESKVDKIKYLAIYQSAPVSAITHYATVDRIGYYSDGKRILYFNGSGRELENYISAPIGEDRRRYAVFGRKYSAIDRILNASTLADVFE